MDRERSMSIKPVRPMPVRQVRSMSIKPVMSPLSGSNEKLNEFGQDPVMGEYLCIGDYICLYCEETEGYVYSEQSSATDNGLCIYTNQDRNRPTNIPNQHVVVFQVCIQNRYKLNKKYRKWLTTLQADGGLESGAKAALTLSRGAAEAENNDNELEQKRQHGKRVRYGEIVQLKHILTSKFVHMSTTQTSQIDKNYMKVSLHDFNAKNAQFRILPRYKVKSEGEVVQLYDQIVFESVKSPGHYFHASEPHQLDYKSHGISAFPRSELNLGVERSSFTLIGSYRETLEQERFVRGGSVIRLFHKELEAYLVAEGLFDEGVTEDVHFRIRVIDQHRPKTLSPSTSGITYWQIEAEHSILDGDVLRWEQQIRLRHMLTRLYLCIDSRSEVSLIADPADPRTVFRLHSVLKEQDEIQYESYARIEHVLTGCWLHALKDEDYEKREFRSNDQEMSMYGLRWDGASTRKVSASGESMYDDAYTIQMVEKQDVMNFNFVAGMVPFLFNLINDFQTGTPLTAKKTHGIIAALKELKYFMTVDGQPDKDRQKLMRNLRVIDLLVRLLQCPLKDGDEEPHMIRIFKEAYDVLHAYMIGKSRKNALYFAKYIDFFQTQFTQKGGIGLYVAQMIVELIRDKRKIVDRITNHHLDIYIDLLRKHQNYRFLDLLQVLCVCDGVSIPNNQTYITEKWLRSYKDSVYLTDRGQNINKRPNIVYVSTNNTQSWCTLHEFVNPDSVEFNEGQYEFLIHQLELFKSLTYGRNDFAIHVITREFGYLTWEDAFLCITSDLLPDSIRAKYCELIIGLFVDVGNNYSVLDNPNICFVYEYVGSKDSEREQSQFVVKDLVTIFPVLRDWLAEFLNCNCVMTASDIGHNLLIEQVLRLLQHLVKFGYYSDIDDVRHLLQPLLSQLDGRHDVPFPKDKSKGYSKEGQKSVNKYRESGRFETSKESEAIVKAKYQAMEVLDLLLTFQRNIRLKTFVEKFKVAELSSHKKRGQTSVEPLLYESFNPIDTSKKGIRKQKEVLKDLKDMFHASSIFEIDSTTTVLMDLSDYKYDMMVMKSLDILNKLYSSQSDMFRLALEAQILLSQDSARVHREVQRSLPVLRRLAKQKLNDQQVLLMSEILDELAEFCHLPKNPHEPHFMNQNIMISHGILDIVLDILSQEIDAKLLKEQYGGMKVIFQKTLYLLQLLTRENDNVQFRIFNHLDRLLDVQVVPSDLALALKEVFIANQATCLKVHPQQIKKIVRLAAEHQNQASEFLDLLNVLVKVEGLDLTIKRNQALVMKYIMQNFKKAAYVLDQPRESREHILTNQAEEGHLAYFAHLVDLLATCAEGENKFIESLCQTILPVEEILWVINHQDIDCNIKRPFIKFMMWVYMKPAENLIESGAADLQHHKNMWDFIGTVVGEINQLSESVKGLAEKTADLLKMSPSKSAVAESNDTSSLIHSGIYYILEGVMPFIEVFYTSFFSPDKDLYPDEIFHTDSLATALVAFSDVIGSMLTNPAHMKCLVTSVTAVVTSSSTPKSLLVTVLEKFTSEMKVGDTKSAVRKGNMEYYAAELELNAKFHTFAQNCSRVHVGHNTVQQQLKYKSKREYTELGSNEELPLGEEFQNLVKCFIDQKEKKPNKRYALTKKLLEQLAISAKKIRFAVSSSRAQEELDVKCLQILRTIIHNEERKLPDDWTNSAVDAKVKKQLAHIKDIQTSINVHDVVNKVLPHLARRSDAIAREVLAFVSIMLFNANREVQQSLLDYFFSTREEVFFMAVRDRMQVSTNSIKEKLFMIKKSMRNAGRALLAQHETRRGEFMANFGTFQTSLTLGRKALQKIQHYELRLKKEKMHGWRALSRAREPLSEKQRRKSKKRKNSEKKKSKPPPMTNGLSKDYISDRSNENLLQPGTPDKMMEKLNVEYKPDTGEIEMVDVVVDEEEDSAEQMFSDMDESVADMLEYKDDGCIELVLKVLARICDGQHVGLQNYLREQPDNVKSLNIIGETAQFLNVVYSSINRRTVDLVIQLFSTLNEFCSGNQENREVIYNKKAIDYINFILRAGEIADCSPEKVLDLRESISSLILSLIEENGPSASQVAKEVKDTLDKEALYRCMAQCYEMHQSEKPKLEDIVKSEAGYMQSAKSIASLGGSLMKGVVKGPQKNALKENLMAVGFKFYLILARMHDIDPQLDERLLVSPEQIKAYDYYKKNSTSVEIVKDDVLQKINFRIKNKILIREEVKEKLKWNVDRTSPSNKIRDLMDWTRDIMQDISYQRKILFNPIAIMFTKGWLLWNHLVTFLSFAINILMLLTWNAKASLEDYERIQNAGNTTNDTFNFALLKDPQPAIGRIPEQEYTITMYILSGVHNLFSLFVLISYFLSNHPRLPTCSELTDPFRSCCNKNKDKGETVGKRSSEDKPSKLDVKFFSFTTFFYILFLAMSAAGTQFHGYFFAFHLLNIVNNNQLLSGVIKAVTQNGVSLLWVAILGFIVIYIYSLVGFSLLRAYFAPGDYLYCSTLWQCTVTVIRYGLIGDMFEQVKQGESERTFATFWPIVLYHVSFFIFITTIGLNIIFGIIVDTFSELRDLKWRAESDMKDTCFVCSRNSYDFEHHGKGFDFHVRNEHNMWSYVFFFIHLNDMKTSDYTAIELYVSKLLDQENYDFFPMNRALCLSSIDIDSTESKIDDLLHQVTAIAQKQREDEAEKKRKVEKLKQKRWQEKHRRFIFGIHHSTDENELGDREPLVPPSNSSNEGVYAPRQPEGGNMLSVSDESEYYKEKRGSLSLLQILEGLPDDKSSRASRASSKSHIISESDEESDTDSAGSTGPVESYDLLKSRETSRDRIDSIPEEVPVIAVPIPHVSDTDSIDEAEQLPPPPPEETEERHLVPHHAEDEETTHL
ncbi:inositol 1,4,5-trisphosphate receptor type 1-like isoform X7 [Mercenaria mercenaria]|uniref:inositol 1,4,5-trisphosphate receptor type 1-like isoform X7 n=1 Tax=Mercenaria mercenaria TaxID=6596 RepID=UPI00234E5A9F|nr:inositol 1,4,5-trisphosphate receptor type 1-like isoform X7 [Mercenaria mercenaria]